MKFVYNSLFSPRKIVNSLNIKNKKYLTYLFLMPLILIIPLILVTIVDSNRLWPDNYDYLEVFNTLDIKDLQIIDGKLNSNETKSVVFDEFLLTFNENNVNHFTKYQIVFSENALTYYIFEYRFKTFTYEELGIENLNFNDSLSVLNLSNIMVNIVSSNTIFKIIDIITWAFVYIIDYIMIVFFFTIISQLMTPIRLPFKMRLRLSTYLSTSYLVTTLILTLFNYESLFIPMIVSYIYHLYVYRNLKVVKVGVKQDE